MTINVNDRVRSYDFPGMRDDCYVEGVVEKIGRFPDFPDCDRYRIRVEKKVIEGKETAPRPRFVFPPVNGTPSWLGGETNGVVKVDS